MNKIPVYVFAKWRVKEGQLDTVLRLLSEVASKSEREAGNLFYKIHQNNADRNIILLYEGYNDENAVAEHRNSEHFQKTVLGEIVPLLEEREVTLTTLVTPGS